MTETLYYLRKLHKTDGNFKFTILARDFLNFPRTPGPGPSKPMGKYGSLPKSTTRNHLLEVRYIRKYKVFSLLPATYKIQSATEFL